MKQKLFWIILPDLTYLQKAGYQVAEYMFVWKSNDTDTWCLSHIPTGTGFIYNFKLLKKIKIFAEAISEMKSIPWSSTDTDDFKSEVDFLPYIHKVGEGEITAEEADCQIMVAHLNK